MSSQTTSELVDSLLALRQADKDLGQHFLLDDSVLDRAVELGNLGPNDHVLEVGPGSGSLTAKLLESGAKVTAVEFDEIAFEHLQNVFSHENLNLVNADALKFKIPLDLTAVVANIPYQISSPLLDKLAQHQRQYSNIHTMVLLLQEEFAIRLSMSEGQSSRGSLGMVTAMEWKTEMDLKVSPHAFKPQPKIQSRLVRLTPDNPINRMENGIPKPNPRLARLIVSTSFEERRKKMRNRLLQSPQRIARVKGWHSSGYRATAKKLLLKPEKEGLPLGWEEARPEQLDLEAWLAIAGWMHELHD